MYIKNKKTGLVQECHNKDVIKTCQKDAEHFEVTLEKPVAVDPSFEAEQEKTGKELDEMTVPELKAVAKEKGLEGYSSLNKEELLAVLKGGE